MKLRPPYFEHDTYLIGGRVLHWPGPFTAILSPVTSDRAAYAGHPRPKMSANQGAGPDRVVLGCSPLLSAHEALAALEAARGAFSCGTGEWPSAPLEKRIACITKLMARLVAGRERLVRTIMWEIAKPRGEVEAEFDRTIVSLTGILKDASELGARGSRTRRSRGIEGRVTREPLGVALCLGPYNYPLFETLSVVVPALVMGNTVIMKPPRFGVLFFHDLLDDLAGCFPAGAVNVLFGDGPTLVEPLMRSGGVDAFAFIGRALTANHLLSLHPGKNRLRSLLGLGAKNAAVVMEDADLDVAVRECLLGALAFNGQRCAAIKIVFVHRSVAGAFLDRMSAAMSGAVTGMPWDKDVRITPMTDTARLPALSAMIEDAVKGGARVLNEGGGLLRGTIISPALVYPVAKGMDLYREEQFGPIIPVVPYEDLSEPIGYIQSSAYGQQASVFGRGREAVEGFMRAVRTSVARLNVNAKCQRGPEIFPFTGRNDSAHGDFSSPAVLEFFSETFAVTRREPAAVRKTAEKRG